MPWWSWRGGHGDGAMTAVVRPEGAARAGGAVTCAAVPAAVPELRSVLRNEGPACGPDGCLAFSLKGEYLEFLKDEQSEELLLFWDAAEKYASSHGHAARAQLSTIVSTYIETGSERELNLDSTLRTRVLSVASATTVLPVSGAGAGEAAQDPPAGLLKDAQMEAEQLMAGDSFPRFIEVVGKTNITARVASNRLALNAAIVVTALLVVALLLEEGMTHRVYRIPSILVGCYSLSYVISAAYRI
jgi:hypothetical protein